MQCFIIKFPNNYYLRIGKTRKYRTKNIGRAFVYCPYSVAEQALTFMKKHNDIMKDCVIVEKSEEIRKRWIII
jgi:hypothetical protein